MASIEANTPLTFSDHLQELRSRLFWCALGFLIGGFIAYSFHSDIINFLQKPLNQPLFFSSPAGGFNFAIKVSVFAGIVATLPIILYQIVRFTEPALPIKIKNSTIIKLIVASLLLIIIGDLFAYYFIIPLSLKFFAGFANSDIKPLISVDDYFGFIVACMVTFAILFQIPLIILFINRIKPIPPKKLLKYQRYVIVAAVAIALILPFTYDPVTQFAMAVPIIVLFYFSIILLWIVNRGKFSKKPKKTVINPRSNVAIPPQVKPKPINKPIAGHHTKTLESNVIDLSKFDAKKRKLTKSD